MSRAFAVRCAGLICLLLCAPAAAVIPVGSQAPQFTLPEWYTGAPVTLHDFAGEIVLLDFYAYWCPHCQSSAPKVRVEIDDYYAARGGNPAGIPVRLVALAVAAGAAQNDSFIQTADLDLVLNDTSLSAFRAYGGSSVPLFILINGVAGANLPQWQVLYGAAGYGLSTGATLRGLIDNITPEPSSLMLLGAATLLVGRRRRPFSWHSPGDADK